MRTRVPMGAVLLMAISGLTACSSVPNSRGRTASPGAHPHGSLVMATDDLLALSAEAGERDGASWIDRRNDPHAADHGVPDFAELTMTEIRSRDTTRTINGRPRDFSSSSSRTITRRQSSD